ncbi:unnamed protein product [Ceutorhynchus assimilis]|uniref:Uncharacterized protein n=1 Tax=Ceutorhynchus assimilis TaxID=467358 RepID=A0A9N9MZY5_9CUCU|nr:unnamed protein product [Ceutorhynchus assimilis]
MKQIFVVLVLTTIVTSRITIPSKNDIFSTKDLDKYVFHKMKYFSQRYCNIFTTPLDQDCSNIITKIANKMYCVYSTFNQIHGYYYLRETISTTTFIVIEDYRNFAKIFDEFAKSDYYINKGHFEIFICKSLIHIEDVSRITKIIFEAKLLDYSLIYQNISLKESYFNPFSNKLDIRDVNKINTHQNVSIYPDVLKDMRKHPWTILTLPNLERIFVCAWDFAFVNFLPKYFNLTLELRYFKPSKSGNAIDVLARKIAGEDLEMFTLTQPISYETLPREQKLVETSYPLITNNYVAYVPKPMMKQRWKIFFNFLLTVFLPSFFGSCFIMALLNKYLSRNRKNNKLELLGFMSLQLNISYFQFENRKTILKSIWLLWCVLSGAVYNSILFRIILMPQYSSIVTSLSDLNSTNLIVYATETVFPFKNTVVLKPLDWRQKIFENKGDAVFIGAEVVLETIAKYFEMRSLYFSYEVLPEVVRPALGGYILKKRSPYFEKIRRLQFIVHEFGFTNALAFRPRERQDQSYLNKFMNFEDFEGVFIGLIAGLSISSLAFCVSKEPSEMNQFFLVLLSTTIVMSTITIPSKNGIFSTKDLEKYVYYKIKYFSHRYCNIFANPLAQDCSNMITKMVNMMNCVYSTSDQIDNNSYLQETVSTTTFLVIENYQNFAKIFNTFAKSDYFSNRGHFEIFICDSIIHMENILRISKIIFEAKLLDYSLIYQNISLKESYFNPFSNGLDIKDVNKVSTHQEVSIYPDVLKDMRKHPWRVITLPNLHKMLVPTLDFTFMSFLPEYFNLTLQTNYMNDSQNEFSFEDIIDKMEREDVEMYTLTQPLSYDNFPREKMLVHTSYPFITNNFIAFVPKPKMIKRWEVFVKFLFTVFLPSFLGSCSIMALLNKYLSRNRKNNRLELLGFLSLQLNISYFNFEKKTTIIKSIWLLWCVLSGAVFNSILFRILLMPQYSSVVTSLSDVNSTNVKVYAIDKEFPFKNIVVLTPITWGLKVLENGGDAVIIGPEIVLETFAKSFEMRNSYFSYVALPEVVRPALGGYILKRRSPYHEKLRHLQFIVQENGFTKALAIRVPERQDQSYIMFAICQINILDYFISNFYKYSNIIKQEQNCTEDESYRILQRELIIMHQEVISYVKDLNGALKYIMLMDLVPSSVQLAGILFQMMTNLSVIQCILLGHFILTLIARIFIYCNSANTLVVKSEAIATSWYNMDWTKLPTDMRRNVALCILRAQRPLYISIGDMGKISLNTFLAILKGTYSYMMLLTTIK